MQQTTKIMFAYYMECGRALDVVWMQRRRLLILNGEFEHAMIKNHYIYSGDPREMLERQQDYPSPLFNRVGRHQ